MDSGQPNPQVSVDTTLLIEFVEKMGLLRRDLQHRGDLEKYEARIARIEQKFSALATRIAETDQQLHRMHQKSAGGRNAPRTVLSECRSTPRQ